MAKIACGRQLVDHLHNQWLCNAEYRRALVASPNLTSGSAPTARRHPPTYD